MTQMLLKPRTKKKKRRPMIFEQKLCLLLSGLLLLVILVGSLTAKADDLKLGTDLALAFDSPPYDIKSLGYVEDTLLFTDSRNLYVSGDKGALDILPLEGFFGKSPLQTYLQAVLVKGEGSLALLDAQSGVFLPLHFKNGQPGFDQALALDWSDHIIQYPDYNQVDPPLEFAVAADILYVLDAPGAAVTRFDLKTGQKLNALDVYAQRILPYQDGRLLLIVAHRENADQPAKRYLAVFDPASEGLTLVRPVLADDSANLPLGGVDYLRLEDTLLMSLGDTVYRYVGLGEGEPCAILPMEDFIMTYLPLLSLPGNKLAVASRHNLFIQSADPKEYAGKTELNLLLSVDNTEGLNQAMQMVQGLVVKTHQMTLSALDFAQLLMTSGSDYDLFWIKLSQVEFDNLMKKGYALDLSGNPSLSAYHAGLSPAIKEVIGLGEEVYALPMSLYATVLLGEERFVFDENRQPTLRSMDDFLTFLGSWPETFGEEYPATGPFRSSEVKYGVYHLALSTYIDQAISKGQPLDFDTADFRALFSRVEALAYEGLEPFGGEEESSATPAIFDNEWIFSLRQMDGDGRDSFTYFPFLLSLKKDQPAPLPLEVNCVFINARSENKDAALRFLESLQKQQGDDARIMMQIKDNTPVENPRYQQELKDFIQRINFQKERIQKADGPEKAELERILANMESHLVHLETFGRFSISEGHIKAYRELSSNAFVRRFDGTSQGANAAFDVLPQYTEGTIDLERFIKDIQSRLRLIQTESQ